MRHRKIILSLVMIYLGLYNCYAQSLTDNLMAFYPFDKNNSVTSDRQIEDHSSNKNNGYFNGFSVEYVKDRFGVDCRAILFDGNSYVSVPNSYSLNSPTDQFSAVVWVKIATGADLFNQWLTILCKSDDSLETTNSPHYRVQATAQTVSLNTEFTELSTPQLAYDTWYFYAYVFDGDKVKVYIDGKYVFEHNYSGKLNANDMPLEIGRDKPGAVEYFNGAMDDLRIYNRALSEYDLDQLYDDRSGARKQGACSSHSNDQNTASNDSVIVISPNDPVYKKEKKKEVPSPPSGVTVDDYKDLPKKIDKTKINYQQTITVKSKDVRIYPYDSEKEDGDVVSINVNGLWVKERFRLLKRKPNPLPRDYVRVSLKEGNDNYLISKAWNVGTKPPNTLTVEIDDGYTVQKIVIDSYIGESGAIRITTQK